MTYNVILTPQNGRFLARVVEFPDCRAEADDRDQVLALIQKRLEEIVNRIEIVQLELPNLEKKLGKPERSKRQDEHTKRQAEAAKPPKLVKLPPMVLAGDKSVHLETPWEYFGIFKDDPTWMPMFEEIERQRDRQIIPTIKRRRKK